MSTRYPGGVITKTPVVPAGPYENGAAPGIWTLDQQLQAAKAGIWPTAGLQPNYIEDVFSTYLYASTSGTDNQVINGIDLSGEGGLVWSKSRTRASTNNYLIDTVRGSSVGNTKALVSNTTAAQSSGANLDYLVFNNNGYTAKAVVGGGELGTNTYYGDLVSWTFREQPKFFDVVTYTGNGVAGLTVAHNLGSAPGCMFVKRTDAAGSWHVFHTSLGGTKALFLNGTNAALTNIRYWNDTAPTSTVFTLGFDTDVNASGGTYVAYLFAHDAGGFGLTGTDNVISCGSFTTDGSGKASVNLGYEPQWLMLKNSTSADNWYVLDNMRGFNMSQGISLNPNLTAAESDYWGGNTLTPNATGFSINNNIGAGATWIYVSIRRGPMKVPTSGTSVFTPVLRNGTGSTATVTSAGGVVDLVIPFIRNGSAVPNWFDRLRGRYLELRSNGSNPENSYSDTLTGFDVMTGFSVGSDAGGFGVNTSGQSIINWSFGRAPGFFDEVCYSGLNSYQDLSHNLGTTPQMIIIKNRTTNGTNWTVGLQGITGTGKYLVLNSTAAVVSDVNYFGSSWTSTNVLVDGNVAPINQSGSNYVMYLFATVAGVSKVGSYTGTGTTQTINCGFTAGARFVLIKRTDSTGDWYVWDSARGIVAGNDPFLWLNSTAAENTSTDYVDTASSGFEISSTAPAAINANGGSFIFLAIA